MPCRGTGASIAAATAGRGEVLARDLDHAAIAGSGAHSGCSHTGTTAAAASVTSNTTVVGR